MGDDVVDEEREVAARGGREEVGEREQESWNSRYDKKGTKTELVYQFTSTTCSHNSVMYTDAPLQALRNPSITTAYASYKLRNNRRRWSRGSTMSIHDVTCCRGAVVSGRFCNRAPHRTRRTFERFDWLKRT